MKAVPEMDLKFIKVIYIEETAALKKSLKVQVFCKWFISFCITL